jgi:hypothetical protein
MRAQLRRDCYCAAVNSANLLPAYPRVIRFRLGLSLLATSMNSNLPITLLDYDCCTLCSRERLYKAHCIGSEGRLLPTSSMYCGRYVSWE